MKEKRCETKIKNNLRFLLLLSVMYFLLLFLILYCLFYASFLYLLLSALVIYHLLSSPCFNEISSTFSPCLQWNIICLQWYTICLFPLFHWYVICLFSFFQWNHLLIPPFSNDISSAFTPSYNIYILLVPCAFVGTCLCIYFHIIYLCHVFPGDACLLVADH